MAPQVIMKSRNSRNGSRIIVNVRGEKSTVRPKPSQSHSRGKMALGVDRKGADDIPPAMVFVRNLF
jgi:hypothetical protein